MSDVRFIRKNGHIIPIRGGKDKVLYQTKDGKAAVLKHISVGERAFKGVKSGASMGFTLGGSIGLGFGIQRLLQGQSGSVVGMLAKPTLKGAAIGTVGFAALSGIKNAIMGKRKKFEMIQVP